MKKTLTLLLSLCFGSAIAQNAPSQPRWRIGVEGGVTTIPGGSIMAYSSYRSGRMNYNAAFNPIGAISILHRIGQKWHLGIRSRYTHTKVAEYTKADFNGKPAGTVGTYYGKPSASFSVVVTRDMGGGKLRGSVGAYAGYVYDRIEGGFGDNFNANGIMAGIQGQGRYYITHNAFVSLSAGFQVRRMYYNDGMFDRGYLLMDIPVMAGVGFDL